MFDLLKLALVCTTVLLLAAGILLALPKSKLRDFLMPIFSVCFAIGCGAYIISPLDAFPDVVPGVGWVDDGVALIAGIAAARSAIRAGKASRDSKS